MECIAKKYDFSCFNLWICRDGQSNTVYYAPYWFEGQKVILEQEVFSTTPIKNKSYPGSQNPKKRL